MSGFLSTTTGLLYGEGVKQLVVQVMVALFAVLWSGVFTLIIGLAIKYTMGWRIDADHEVEGIDFTEHGESAYDLAGATGARRGLTGGAPILTKQTVSEGANA